MHVPRLRALLIGAVLVLPIAASGAPPAPATLQALVEQAWLRSPDGRGSIAREAEAAAARRSADSWLAGQPVLGLAQRSGQDSANALRETEISIAAPLWMPGQRSARRNLAALSTAEWQAQARMRKLEVAGQVRTRLWDAAAAQALLEEKQGHLHHIEELRDEVRSRVAAGDLARVDFLLAEQEVQAGIVAVEQARADAHAARARLRMLTGPTGELPAERETLAAQPAKLLVQAARAASERAQAALQLAQASRSAVPTVSLSVRRERESVLAPPDRSLGIAVQVPIGTAGRNRPAETQARTQLAIAAAEAEQSEMAAQAELDIAKAQLDAARAALGSANARMATMAEHYRLIDKAFRLGERGLAEVLRSRALFHEAQVAQRQQEITLGRAHAQFNQASGVLP